LDLHQLVDDVFGIDAADQANSGGDASHGGYEFIVRRSQLLERRPGSRKSLDNFWMKRDSSKRQSSAQRAMNRFSADLTARRTSAMSMTSVIVNGYRNRGSRL